MNDRQKQILDIINSKGEIHLNKLSELFPGYSVMTLRRDLIYLESKGLLVRIHGGAVSKTGLSRDGEEDAYSMRIKEHRDAKIVIANKAVSYVEKGRSIYFDAGTTVMQLAKTLQDDNFTIITSAVNTALELVKHPKVSVILPGGNVNSNTLSCSGPTSLIGLSQMNIDLAFMSASGFSFERGFTVSNMNECELKKTVIKKANKVFVLMDTSKFNKDLAFTFAYLEDVDVLICEDNIPEEIRRTILEKNIVLL